MSGTFCAKHPKGEFLAKGTGHLFTARSLILRVAETSDGVTVVKSLGRQKAEIDQFDAVNDQLQGHQQAVFHTVSRFGPTVQFLTQVNLVILLLYGGHLVSTGQLQLGTGLIVFAGLLQQFSNQVANLSSLAGTIQQSLTGARRVLQVLDAEEEVVQPAKPWIPSSVMGKIEIEGVWFEYAPGSPVLRDISLTIEPGQRVGILGGVVRRPASTIGTRAGANHQPTDPAVG